MGEGRRPENRVNVVKAGARTGSRRPRSSGAARVKTKRRVQNEHYLRGDRYQEKAESHQLDDSDSNLECSAAKPPVQKERWCKRTSTNCQKVAKVRHPIGDELWVQQPKCL